MVDDIWKNGRATEESNLAIPFEGFKGLDSSFLLQEFYSGAEVELEDVKVVGFHTLEALVTGFDYVFAAVIV